MEIPKIQIVYKIGATFCFLSIVGCFGQMKNSNKLHRDAAFVMSDSDLAGRLNRSSLGDAKSSYQLYLHYWLGQRDKEQGKKWLETAASQGNMDAAKILKRKNVVGW